MKRKSLNSVSVFEKKDNSQGEESLNVGTIFNKIIFIVKRRVYSLLFNSSHFTVLENPDKCGSVNISLSPTIIENINNNTSNNQNNIRKEIEILFPDNIISGTLADNFLNTINTLDPFTISDIQIVNFKTVSPTNGLVYIIELYNYGKGDYGFGNTQLTLDDIVIRVFNSNQQVNSYYLNRVNHTGTQVSSTISDFNTAVNALITYVRVITALGFTPEDKDNKSTSSSEYTSTTKFPVWSAIVAYFSTSKIKTILGQASSTIDGWLSSTDWNTFNNKQNALGYTAEDIANKGVNNGYAALDSGGKVPLANLPSTLLKYQGVWNAATNLPSLGSPDTSKIGNVYNVGVAGTRFGIIFNLGDWLIYNASGVPEKSDNSDDVVSVNGQTGVVTLTTSTVSEGSNQYFTVARVLASILSGLDTTTNIAISSVDSVLSAFGKLQKQITDLIASAMSKTANGSDINDIKVFRANLGVDKLRTVGNSSYTILNTDKAVVTSATFTAPRTWNLPLANTVNAGYEIIIADLSGGVTSTNNLTITTNGTDTTNGATSTTIAAAYGMRRFISDGVSKWTFDGGVMRISDYIGTTLTANTIVATDANSKLQPLTDVILGSFVNNLTTKSTIVNNDVFNIADSATSYTEKKVLFSVLKAMILANPALTGVGTFVGTTATSSSDVMFDISQTWNGASINPTLIKVSVTETLTAGNSAMFLDFKLNGTTVFSVSKQGNVVIAGNLSLSNQILQNIWESSGANAASTLRFKGNNSTGLTPKGFVIENTGASNIVNHTSGTFDLISTLTGFSPASGAGSFRFLTMNNIINQTGSASGIISFLYCNPTLTSLLGELRALDITSGSIVLPYFAATTTYAIKSSDYLLNFTTGTFTATLPTAVGCSGKHYVLINSGTGVVTIATTSSQTINGLTTVSLLTQYSTITVISNGANWIIKVNNQGTFNSLRGTFSVSATAQTAFTVTFGGTQPNNTYFVGISPLNSLTAAQNYIMSKTTTSFTVTFLTGLTGTVNFDWVLHQ